MLCHWICSYTLTGDVSFEVEEDRSFRNLLLSPQCPVWRRPPVFVRKWSIVSSLFPPNEYFQSFFPRVPVDESGARLVIPAERQHEPPLEPTDAHAQLLSDKSTSTRALDQILGWFQTVESSIRNDMQYYSEKTKPEKALRHAILSLIMQFLQVCMSLYTLLSSL